MPKPFTGGRREYGHNNNGKHKKRDASRGQMLHLIPIGLVVLSVELIKEIWGTYMVKS